MRVFEVMIRLLRDLIQHGWKAKASPQLFQELLVFLSLAIGGVPGQANRRELPEETTIEAFRTLAALIRIAQPHHLAAPADVPESKSIQALFSSVEIMLDGITEGAVASVQLEAVNCLETMFTTIRDNAVLARFFPGTVSALTKILSPPLANQTQKRVLRSCLEALRLVLINVLGDLKVRGIINRLEKSDDRKEEPLSDSGDSEPLKELTPAWLKATGAQVKIALSAVLKLRTHESEDIQSAVYRLCIALLDECHSSLANCQSILVESSLMLEDETPRSRLETSLQDLAGVYPELGESIKLSLHSWVTGLPRVMQSNDERVKQIAIRSIIRGSKLAAALHIDSPTFDNALGDSLRDSLVTLIRASKPPRITDAAVEADLSMSTDLAASGMELALFSPILLDSEGQKTTRNEVKTLISSIGSSTQQVNLANLMLSYIRDSEGVDRIASFWLAFELIKSTYTQSSDLDTMVDLSSLGESRRQDLAFQELYEFSASVLSAHSDSVETDWQMEAIALEVTAFAASRLKLEFRPELIDILYPITTFLGSQIPQLRRHAITTLNILAAACGYQSVSELIVDNADYMVNSVSLRLGAFDISLASTKVLTMLIRLTGPKLIPYLDDVITAIFGALDSYHGYPVFVESMFSVLSEVVTQGVKSDMLLLEGSGVKSIDHRKKRPTSLGIPGILQMLDKRLDRAKRSKADGVDLSSTPETHPKRPWTQSTDDSKSTSEAASLLDALETEKTKQNSTASEDDAPSHQEGQQPQEVEPSNPPPPTPTYTLLTRILSLAQHYLTSPTPTLRKSLLDLVGTVSPALAPDENAFLPLVHAVWPVVLARLRDPEPYVAVAACRALAALCRAAGDFLASRFKTEWPGAAGLAGWVARVKSEAGGVGRRGAGARRVGGGGEGLRVGVIKEGGVRGEGEGILIPIRSAGGGGGDGLEDGDAGVKLVQSSSSRAAALGRFAQASQVWEAVLELLAAIVSYVRVDDDMFDDILELVVDVLPQHAELKEALETVNVDAVWLALYERGMVAEGREPPVVEEGLGLGLKWKFARMDLRGVTA
jgi:hypothetical protein